MKLYTVALAPNPTKVMLYIAERTESGPDLPIEQVTVNTLKGRHRDCKMVRRKGVIYIINKTDPRFKAKQG